MEKDQMFSQMHRAALARLAGRAPEQIAANAGIRYEAETRLFQVPTLGMDVAVSYPDSVPAPVPGNTETLAAG